MPFSVLDRPPALPDLRAPGFVSIAAVNGLTRLNPVRFALWALRDKAAQRRLAPR